MKITERERYHICDRHEKGFGVTRLAEKYGVTRSTIYNALKEGKPEYKSEYGTFLCSQDKWQMLSLIYIRRVTLDMVTDNFLLTGEEVAEFLKKVRECCNKEGINEADITYSDFNTIIEGVTEEKITL